MSVLWSTDMSAPQDIPSQGEYDITRKEDQGGANDGEIGHRDSET